MRSSTETRVDIRTYLPVVVSDQSCLNEGSSFKRFWSCVSGWAVFGSQSDVVLLSGAESHAELRHGRQHILRSAVPVPSLVRICVGNR